MNYLVIGGNGYLGSKVVTKLVEQGHKIVCTKRKDSNLSRLLPILNEIIFIPASIDAIEVISNIIHFDYVLNLACNYGRNNVLYDNVLESNIDFPLSILNLMVMRGVKNFLTIGTGLPNELNMYSFSKKIYSDFGKFYSEKHNVSFIVLKLEMFYGSDEPKDRFLPSIIIKMLKGESIEITKGTQKRDIIAIEDIIVAIFAVIKSRIAGYLEIPIGSGISPSISEIVDFIWEATGKKSTVHKGVVPMRVNEPDCVANTTIIKSLCKWEPIEWRIGLKKMIGEIKKEQNL